jgi:hypothetical protein
LAATETWFNADDLDPDNQRRLFLQLSIGEVMRYHNITELDWAIGKEKVSRPPKKDRQEKRSGCDRRVFSYAGHIPERRSGKDRRRAQQKINRGVRPIVGAWGLQRPVISKE